MSVFFFVLFCAAALNAHAATTVVKHATAPIAYDTVSHSDRIRFTLADTALAADSNFAAFWIITGTTKAKVTTTAAPNGLGIICHAGTTVTSAAGCYAYSCTSATVCTIDTVSLGTCTAGTGCDIRRPLLHSSGNVEPGVPFSIVYTNTLAAYTQAALATLDVTAATVSLLNPVTIDVLTADPETAYAATITASSADTISIAFPSTASGIFGIGWGASATALFPSWALVCSPQVAKTCFTVTCTSPSVCTATDAVQTNTVMWEPSASFLKSVAVSTVDTAGALKFVYGSQANLLWTSGVATAQLTAATASQGFWNRYTTVPTVAAYTATGVPFTATLSATAPNIAQITMTSSAAAKLNALGWKADKSLNPAFILACNVQETTAANQCALFTCPLAANKPVGQPGTVNCAQVTPVYAGSSVKSQSGLTMVYERLLQPAETGAHVITPGIQNLLFYEAAAVGSAISTVTNVSSPTTTYVANTANLVAFQGTAPTYGVSATSASATNTILTITTNSGKYASTGLGSATQTFPSIVSVCEPVTLDKCGIYSCTAASTCVASTATVVQTRDAAARVATLNFTNTDLPARSTEPEFEQQQRLPGKNTYLFWAEDSVPAAGLTLAPSLVQGKTWNTFALSSGPAVTVPTFPIAFSRASATSINVTMTPGTGKTAYFGWNSSSSAVFPTDAVICTTNSQACIDVSCSDAATCIARATTIYTANTTTTTTANLTRPLSGGVVIPSTGNMFLSWDIVDTPATAITAASAQSRSWKYYTAQVPQLGTSNNLAIVPSLLVAFLLLANML